MKIDSDIENIVDKVMDGDLITKDEIICLLKKDYHSLAGGMIMAAANEINRAAFQGKAEVHAQIGLNLSPCPNKCLFCAFAAANAVFKERNELDVEDVIQLALKAEISGANAIFFMTTGDYPFGRFIEISKDVRRKLKPDTVMIANIGDFGYQEGRQLKDVGYKGIYHAIRMGEGKVTNIEPQTRLTTFRAAHESGLLLGTCVEPVGPEHSIEEIAEKILIGRDARPAESSPKYVDTPPSPPNHTLATSTTPTIVKAYPTAFL